MIFKMGSTFSVKFLSNLVKITLHFISESAVCCMNKVKQSRLMGLTNQVMNLQKLQHSQASLRLKDLCFMHANITMICFCHFLPIILEMDVKE